MMRIELSDEDRAVLAEVLLCDISDIGMEIANTDRLAMRDALKARRAALQRVLGQLREAADERPARSSFYAHQ